MKEMATNHEKNMKKKDSEVWQQLVEQNWREGEEVEYRHCVYTTMLKPLGQVRGCIDWSVSYLLCTA